MVPLSLKYFIGPWLPRYLYIQQDSNIVYLMKKQGQSTIKIIVMHEQNSCRLLLQQSHSLLGKPPFQKAVNNKYSYIVGFNYFTDFARNGLRLPTLQKNQKILLIITYVKLNACWSKTKNTQGIISAINLRLWGTQCS